eukprot:TRINITY_DN14953_c0_g1_i2.p1 TRINITY_DN14953_c0_g1~~TRINITY_DN14953_c0_g1_i2.p1  ORF type:complete len:172 (+),score=14.68 TRINITY_DN14953_c0_g1_i2:467-982(+)
MNVLVFGSTEPWYEALALAAGAHTVTTVEYNRLVYEHPAITTVMPFEFEIPPGGFDAALSVSSFDHDGLGRYGDPISPDADVRAMRIASCALRPGGMLYVSVPVGPDAVVWNLHRRYGPARLPCFLQGWDVVEAIGWDEKRLSQPGDVRQSYEPFFVLRSAARGAFASEEL